MLQCFSWLADWRLGSCHMSGYSRLVSVSVMIRHLSIYLYLLPCTPSMPSLSLLAYISHLVFLSLYIYVGSLTVWWEGGGGHWPPADPGDAPLYQSEAHQTGHSQTTGGKRPLWSITDYLSHYSDPPQTTVAPYRPLRPTTHHECFHMCHSGLCFHYVLSDLFKPFIPPSLSISNAIFTSSVFSLSHWGSTILCIWLLISLHLSLSHLITSEHTASKSVTIVCLCW